MKEFPSPLWLRYVIPLVTTALALLVRVLLISWVEGRFPLLLFILPVVVSAWFGGVGPGLVATILGALSGIFFIHPYNLDIAAPSGQERIALYLVVSITSAVIIAQLQAARRHLEDKERQLKQEIIERQHIEEELRQQAAVQQRMEDALKAAVEKAEHANSAKSEFLAHISHEIRTPMNAVIGIGNILATCRLSPEKQQEMVHTLQLSAQSLMALIDELLDIAKIENGQVELERAPFNLRTLAEDIVNILSVKAREKHLILTLVYDAQTEQDFIGDAHRIRQIVMNLAGNAIKFTEKGSVTLMVSALPGGGVTIAVHDTGIGIAPDKLHAVFGKFSQADSSITRRFGGTGLGLAISKMLAELMQGAIQVESVAGRGSVFTVALPLQHAPIRQPQRVATRLASL